MSQFRMSFDCDNSAFGHTRLGRIQECARILRETAHKLELDDFAPGFYRSVTDTWSGNVVGGFRLTDEENAWRDKEHIQCSCADCSKPKRRRKS